MKKKVRARKPRAAAASAGDLALRDQEVVRASRELAAYFKGLRTEREARAALKTIKAFVRDRERAEPGDRRPLPGLRPPKTAAPAVKKAASTEPIAD